MIQPGSFSKTQPLFLKTLGLPDFQTEPQKFATLDTDVIRKDETTRRDDSCGIFGLPRTRETDNHDLLDMNIERE
jgi:hypothetical protein